ncbi:Uncharacterised protein r2_g557 [Pycnogonum litorale]
MLFGLHSMQRVMEKVLRLFVKLSTIIIFFTFSHYFITNYPIKAYDQTEPMERNGIDLLLLNQSNYINWNTFTFIASPSDICDEVEPFVIVFVSSHPSHKEARRILRRVYNRSVYGNIIRVVFVHGWIFNRTLQSSVEEESKQYGDIIQGNFEDSYKSISYFHLTGLRWATTHCRKAKFILKADDDIYIDVITLVKSLNTDRRLKLNDDFIYCDPIYKAIVKRDPDDRYYVSEKQYPNQTYPSYCNGWAVLYPYKVGAQVLIHSDRVPFMWMSDVFTTGIIRSEIKGIDIVKMAPGYTWDVNTLKLWLRQGTEKEKHIVGPVWGDNQLLIKLHQKTGTLPRNFEEN